jgi:hypothetical protein
MGGSVGGSGRVLVEIVDALGREGGREGGWGKEMMYVEKFFKT